MAELNDKGFLLAVILTQMVLPLSTQLFNKYLYVFLSDSNLFNRTRFYDEVNVSSESLHFEVSDEFKTFLKF